MVVEKEASLKTLLEYNFHLNCGLGPGLLVTVSHLSQASQQADLVQGKGYPDLATLRFLRSLITVLASQTPLFGIFDGDPDGLDIYRCYTSGSKVSANDPAAILPEMKWLGVDIGLFLESPIVMDASIIITARDRVRAGNMLSRLRYDQNTDVDARRRMLQLMLMLNSKIELQALDVLPGGVCTWLRDRMVQSYQ